jgi:hypothetical protein
MAGFQLVRSIVKIAVVQIRYQNMDPISKASSIEHSTNFWPPKRALTAMPRQAYF